jgi:DNA-binding transcriptional regulator YdaS (Cro superfamily)
MTANDVRRERLAWLRDHEFGGYATRLAAKVERSPSQVGQWLGGFRQISAESARWIERKVGYAKYWLDGDVHAVARELSPMAQRLARAFDTIENAQTQTELFVEFTGKIEDAATPPVPPAAKSPLQPRIRQTVSK